MITYRVIRSTTSPTMMLVFDDTTRDTTSLFVDVVPSVPMLDPLSGYWPKLEARRARDLILALQLAERGRGAVESPRERSRFGRQDAPRRPCYRSPRVR